jgi:erythritol transport system permease protein
MRRAVLRFCPRTAARFPTLPAGRSLAPLDSALSAAYIARYTPLGRHIFAVGGNERAARMSGVRVNLVKMFVYMFSGFCAAIVGLVISSELMASHPATGESFELNAIAAAVLGGTSMSGGRGTIGGTIIGAFVNGVLSDGQVMKGVS